MRKKAVIILIIVSLLSGCVGTEKVNEINNTNSTAEKISLNLRPSNRMNNVSAMDLDYKIIPGTHIESIILPPSGLRIKGDWLRDDKIKVFNFKVINFIAVNTSRKDDMRNVHIEWVRLAGEKNTPVSITIAGSNNFSTHIEVEGTNERGRNFEMYAEGIR